MKVSILTPTKNNFNTISQTIESVIMQDYREIEYIIVCGNNDIETTNLINSYKSGISKIIFRSSSSPCEAMNFSLQQATGDIIGSLFGDDFFADSSIISKVVECFKDDSVQCVYGDMVFVNRDNTNKILRYWKSSKFNKNSFIFGWHPTWVATFYRRSVFEKYGYLNTDLKIACDYEFLLRTLHIHKIKAVYLPEIVVIMRSGGSSNKKIINLLYANYESCKAWSLNGLRMPLFFFLYKPFSKFYQFFIRP